MIDRIIKNLMKILTKISGFLMFLMFALICIQVVARSVFSISTPWTEEIARYVLIWMTFLASPVVLYNCEHLTVDLFLTKYSVRVRRIIRVFSDIFIVFFCMYLIYFGFVLCSTPLILNFSSPTSNIPRVLIYVSLPLSSVFMFIVSIYDIYRVYLISKGLLEDNKDEIADELITLEEIDKKRTVE